MNFQPTKEQEFVRKMVREFAVNEVEPLAADIDKEHRFPVETVEKMAKYGLLGIPFPTQYGGAGGDHISYAITVEELSRVCASTGVICSAHTSLCCWPIFNWGNEEQKMKYLPDLLSGKKIRQIFHFLFFITPVEDWPAAQGSVRRADNACGCTDSG